jgi:hypothetical protein
MTDNISSSSRKRKQSDLEEDFELLAVAEDNFDINETDVRPNKRLRTTEADANNAVSPDQSTLAPSTHPAS